MLMKPIADAAAVAPRNIVGIGQKAGKCAYSGGPYEQDHREHGTIQFPSVAAATTMPTPGANGTATCTTRSPVRSECQPLISMPSSAMTYGSAARVLAITLPSRDWDLMIAGMNMPSP